MSTRPATTPSRAVAVAAIVAAVIGAACTSAPAKPERVDGTAPATSPSRTPQIAKIGGADGYLFPDGLRVVVASATRFTIGQAAAGGKPGQVGVVITVTITNGTTQPVDLSLTTVHLSYGAAGQHAEQVYDVENNLGSGFDGKVASSRAATAQFGFAVDPDGLGQIDVEVVPGFLHYDSVLFTGSAA